MATTTDPKKVSKSDSSESRLNWLTYTLIAALVSLSFKYYQEHYPTPKIRVLSRSRLSPADLLPYDHEPKLSPIIISYSPLIIYLEDFINRKEIDHIKALAAPLYELSHIDGSNGNSTVSPHRTSTSAFLPRDDPVIINVTERAARFQGFVPPEFIENLQATRYTKGQQYKTHWDISDELYANETTRYTTIFAILEDNCENCGTRFPWIGIDWSAEDHRWCGIVDCKNDTLIVNPRAGGAVFWKNIGEDGLRDDATFHAGLPLLNGGHKIGLNIWTRNGTYY